MPEYYCIECGRQTHHLNVKEAADYCEVSRATVYSWLHSGLVHSLVRPSGRAFICQASLLVPGFDVFHAPHEHRVDETHRGRDEIESDEPEHATPHVLLRH